MNGKRYLIHDRDPVREDRPTPVTGIDGREALRMGLAARKSYDERRAVRTEEIA